jgi:hypothetical protein
VGKLQGDNQYFVGEVFMDIDFSDIDGDEKSTDLVPMQNNPEALIFDEEFSRKQNWLNQLNYGLNYSFSQLLILQDQIRWSNAEASKIQTDAIKYYKDIMEKANEYAIESQKAYEESRKKIESLKDEIRNLEIKKAKLEIEIKMLKNQKDKIK